MWQQSDMLKKGQNYQGFTSAMSFTMMYLPAKEAVAMVSSWRYLPWIIDVYSPFLCLPTAFQTYMEKNASKHQQLVYAFCPSMMLLSGSGKLAKRKNIHKRQWEWFFEYLGNPRASCVNNLNFFIIQYKYFINCSPKGRQNHNVAGVNDIKSFVSFLQRNVMHSHLLQSLQTHKNFQGVTKWYFLHHVC